MMGQHSHRSTMDTDRNSYKINLDELVEEQEKEDALHEEEER